jgi:DNA-directed RNA polymerase specialized sigma24 family protein
MHRRLVRIFACWGCSWPEDLADRTLDRVVAKAEAVQEGYEGDPFAYVLGVARNVRREDFRAQARARSQLSSPPLAAAGADERMADERKLSCLDRCLAESLAPEEKELLLEYYREARAASARRAMAREGGLSSSTLRKRTQRYRQRLEQCLRRCLGWPEAVTEQGAAT